MARSLEAYNRTRNKDKGKKKKSRIEEITDILGDMSPGQLSGLENFIAGERQGENIRGVVDPNAIAESAPGLGVRTGAPELTDFGAGSLGGARMEALPLREPPEDKPSRMSRLMGGLGRVGKGVGGFIDRNFVSGEGGVLDKALGGRGRWKGSANASARGRTTSGVQGGKAIKPRRTPEGGEEGKDLRTIDTGGGRKDLTGPSFPSAATDAPSPLAPPAPTRAASRGAAGGLMGGSPDSPRVASAPGEITRRRQEAPRVASPPGDITRQRQEAAAPAAPSSARDAARAGADAARRRATEAARERAMRRGSGTQPRVAPAVTEGLRGPQNEMTQQQGLGGPITSNRIVPGPRAETSQEKQKRIMGTATDMPVGGAGAIQAAGAKINTGGPQMRAAPNTVGQTFGNALYGGKSAPDPRAGAAMSEDPGRVSARAEPKVRLMQIEKQAANMLKRAQAGDQNALAELEGLFAEADRIEPPVRGAGRPTRTLDRGMSGTSDARGGQGMMGGARVPSAMQSRNLNELRAQYNAIRNAQSAGGRSQRRAR